MHLYRPTRAARPAAVAAAAAVLGAGCLPSTWVARRAPPPAQVAREEAARAAVAAPEPAPRAATPAPPAAAPRSLADLLDLALAQDPATRAAWFDARAAAAQSGSRRAAWLPSLDATLVLSRQRTGATGRVGESPARSESTQSTLTPTATLSWLLLDAGVRSALVRESDLLFSAARLGEVAAVSDLVLRVQQSYFGYLGARALVEAETAAVKQAEASLAAAQARQRAGLSTVADVLQARTALSQTRLALQQVEGQALALRGGLATLAGLPPTADLDVGSLPAEVDVTAAQPAVEELLAAAEARNPDVGRARATADAAAARARAAARAPWPTLSFQANALQPFYVAPSGVDSSPGWLVGLVLRLPTLEGLGLRAAYDVLAARASADAARARADATAQRVALDVWTGYQAVRTAGGRIATSRDLLEAARASAEVAHGRYREGVGSIVDLLNAQAALELALAESARARADYLVSLAQLARAAGRLDAVPPAPAPPDGPGGTPHP
ncbi:MAG TPA: TolC family protein [Anaeromyxobacter sp.]|nr:TolC family protein [Anaeromyxobacter sp.]